MLDADSMKKSGKSGSGRIPKILIWYTAREGRKREGVYSLNQMKNVWMTAFSSLTPKFADSTY